MTSFQSLDEITEWLEHKCVENVEHPHRLHPSNWQLSEYWFEHDQGIQHHTKKVIQERLQRDATDVGAACTSMMEEPMAKKKGQSIAEKHKTWMGKTWNSIQKLQRCINASEAKLPGLRRSIPAEAYQKLKAGLEQSRSVKDVALEDLQDQKEAMNIDEPMFENLVGLHGRVGECLDAITEAFKAHAHAANTAPSTPSELKVEAADPPAESPA